MPVHYQFSGNLFRMNLEGAYTPEDMIRTFDAALADPRFPEDARFLLDVTRSSEFAGRGQESIKAVAEYFAGNSDRVCNRCAIVAVSQIHYGVGRMAAAFAELRGARVEVFTNVEDAVSWLGDKVETRSDRVTPETV